MKEAESPKLGFQVLKTDKIVYSRFDPQNGKWGPLELRDWSDPAFWPSPRSAAINYALSCFEGLKAHRHKDGRVFIFRPKDHAERLTRTLKGLLMPVFPEEKFLEAVELLVRENIKFVPEYGQGSLYIRPVLYGQDQLGIALNPQTSYVAAFWCSPVSGYYSKELEPIVLWVNREMTRATPGGIGTLKVSANYIISRIAAFRAKEAGCKEAVFLDGKNGKYIEELGAANIFIVKNNQLFTPRLKDTILAGITRKSIITLAREELRLKVLEEDIKVRQLLKADEVFASGTAAIITIVGSVKDSQKVFKIGTGQAGPVTTKLYNLLTGIQRGNFPDKFHWLKEVS